MVAEVPHVVAAVHWYPSLAQLATVRLDRWVAQLLGNRLGYLLVSEYPKSGGTWVARMLADYLAIPFCSAQALPAGTSVVMHNHWPYERRFPRSVYVYRDGRDVMISQFFHLKALAAEAANGDSRRFDLARRRALRLARPVTDMDVLASELPRFLEWQFCSPVGTRLPWHEHVLDWVGRPQVVPVRYEDLLADAHGAMTNVLEGCGVPVDATRLNETVRRESFVVRTGREPGTEDNLSFFRKGLAGDWRNYFTRAAAEVFRRFAGDALVALDYEPDDSWVSSCPESIEPV